MKRITYIALLVSFTFFSCQKELQFSDTENPDPGTPPVTNGDIKGTWKFLFMEMDYKSITEYGQAGMTVKNVARYATKTISNAGTIKVDASKFVGTGFAYGLDTEFLIESYANNVKVDTQKGPLKFNVPAYDFTSEYKQIGNDSLHYESGFVVTVPDGNSPAPIQNPSSGAKFQIRADTLIMSSRNALEQTVNQGGVDVTLTQDVKVDMFFKRQ